MKQGKFIKFITSDLRRSSFYTVMLVSMLTLVSFQNCGKVKFNAAREQVALVPQSCGTITMVPQNALSADTNITFTVVPPTGITISDISWDVTKGATTVHTATTNPMSHTFNHTGEGIGSYLATATFMKSDGNGCELAQSFQIITGDLCVDPSGISGPTVGFVGEETSPFSLDYEDCFVGTVVWDMDTNGIPEYNNLVSDSVTYTYNTPGTYTVTATVIDGEDNSQTVLTHTIVINYENCTNGATNPPTCDQCPTGQVLVGGQCVPACTNGATNPPTCNQCPTGQVLVGGQCVPGCTNGATNPPTCNQCPTGQSMVNNQCTTLTYTWVPGSWSTCSATACGTSGTQTRTVLCVSSVNVPVSDSLCTQPKPATSQPCSAAACNACTLDGVTVPHGQTRNFFRVNTVACGQTCSATPRTCNNGVLSGDTAFNRASCQEASCGYAWQIGNWSACSATACGTSGTQTRSVICKRTDGVTVADSFCGVKPATSQACSAPACNSCALPWGGSIAHGQGVPAYAASSVACGQTCAAQTRTCNNGVLSGTYTKPSCAVAACPVNGTCGSANGTTVSNPPTSGLCSKGTASSVTTGSSNYSWTCAGSGGGSTASCSATRQLYAISSCGFSLTSSNWRGDAGQPSMGYNSCEWGGSMYMGSSSKVNAIFFFGDYYDNSGPYGIYRLNNPTQWTITATGCQLYTIADPTDYRKKMPNYCRAASTLTYNGSTPLVWNATITATNNSTGEVRILPIRATFKPTTRPNP